MAAGQKAHVNKEVLSWARTQSGLSLEAAAKKIRVSSERLASWEAGTDRPTIVQLRKAARVYQFSFAVFFLPSPPQGYQPIKDFRRFMGVSPEGLSSELTLEIRRAYDRREIALELHRELETSSPTFNLGVDTHERPEAFAQRLRQHLGVTAQEQGRWRDPSIGFKEWRSRIEGAGVLVFQASGIDLEEMRGFSVGDGSLPIVVVNRSDAYAGRSFTLVHELTHVALHNEGLCTLDEDGLGSAEVRRIEVFCNAVAGAALVPASSLLGVGSVLQHGSMRWEPRELDAVARTFAVSRQVIIRRLLDLGCTDQVNYDRIMRELDAEFRALPPRKAGFLSPPADFVSQAGRPYAALVVAAYRENKLGASELADVLGMRLRHLGAIESALTS